MRHILTSTARDLGATKQWQAPNLVVFTRGDKVPVPALDCEQRDEKAASSGDERGTKRELRGKSAKSCLNCARVLSSIDWTRNGECVHVTLTYHNWWPGKDGDGKRSLALAKQSIVQWFGRHCEAGLWSLEYQTGRHAKTGVWVPHWHVLTWMGGRDADLFAEKLRAWWSDHARNDSEFGVHVTRGDQARGTWYLAMHSAKRAQSPPFAVGRWWGYINREAFLAASDIHNVGEVEDRSLVWWARLFRRSTGGKVRQRGRMLQGFSWFLPRAAQCVAGAWIREQIEAERAAQQRRNPF